MGFKNMSDTYKNRDAAARYDQARTLPDETSASWMKKLMELVPKDSVNRVLDLGGGTGRFTGLLQNTYECHVIVIDPSEEMLEQGRNRGLENVTWLCGSAERTTLADKSIDLVWMSNVFHHLENESLAFQEVCRILSLGGYLAIRNGTQESDSEIEWIKCFPEAKQMDMGRLPHQIAVIDAVCKQGFDILKIQTVYQLTTSSYVEHYQKISQRGLSSLISISDEAFSAGLQRLQKWIAVDQRQNQPVYEPIDLFVFQKRHQESRTKRLVAHSGMRKL